jgi:general secretion pathway protein I
VKRSRLRGRRSARGFTLLEVLFALITLAGAMAVLIAMLSGGLRQVAEAERATEATLHAQSLLDALGTLEPLAPGTDDGEFDEGRYRWALAIEEIEDPAPRDLAAAPPGAAPVPLAGGPQVLRVVLDVTWGAAGPRQTLRLVTLRTRTPAEIGATPQ